MLSIKENVILLVPLTVPVTDVPSVAGCPVDVVGKFPLMVLPDWLRNTVKGVPAVPPVGMSVTLQLPVEMLAPVEPDSVPSHGADVVPTVYVPDMVVPSEDTVPV